MPSIEQLRERQKEHARQLESVFFVKSSDLAARWNCEVDEVLSIPRADLPYIERGKSKARRYDPRDVEAYEEREKHGAEHDAEHDAEQEASAEGANR